MKIESMVNEDAISRLLRVLSNEDKSEYVLVSRRDLSSALRSIDYLETRASEVESINVILTKLLEERNAH